MEVDADAKGQSICNVIFPFISLLIALPEDLESPIVDNPALTTALKAFISLTREQKAVLSRTLDGFVACLAPVPTDVHYNPHSRTVITEKAWHNRANWGRDEWNAWETWGWYRQFCRAVCARSAWNIEIKLIGLT
jgi:hypothetical protein